MWNYLNIGVSTRSMEYGLVGCFDCWPCTICDFITALIIVGVPGTLIWTMRIVINMCNPLSNNDLIQIEFPLPQIVPPAPYEPVPVEMLVGSCSEAKRCAYCHEEFECNSVPRFCFACKSATHEECAVLNGGCSVFGCANTTLLPQV
jgi:hypothetical protein